MSNSIPVTPETELYIRKTLEKPTRFSLELSLKLIKKTLERGNCDD